MNKTFYRHSSILTFSIAVMIVFFSLTDVQAAARYRRYVRQPSQPTRTPDSPSETVKTYPGKTSPVKVSPQISPEAAKEQLKSLCEQVKSNFQKLAPNDLNRSEQQLLESTKNLIRTLKQRNADPEAVEIAKNFKLAELQATLQKTETPDKALLDEIWKALHSNEPGVRWIVFDGLRKSLRRYQAIEQLLAKNNYDSQLVNVCENLLKYIDTYSGNREPLYAISLSDVMVWLEDVSLVEPRTAKIVELARIVFSGVNLHAQVSAEFVGAGFNKETSEPLTIDENINGTHLVGAGNITATSSAVLAPAKNMAEIKVIVNADIESKTTGYHSPVTIDTETTGTLKSEKRIQITSDSISSIPAKTTADFNSKTSNVRINAGPLVSSIARQQIGEQRAESQAIAKRRSENKMSQRIDNRIDPKIAELNENFQTKLRIPLVKAGLFPRIWNLSSTPEAIDWSILIGNTEQPSAMNSAPALTKPYDLAVQVHQSALNNAAAIALSGRFLDEDKTIQDLQKQFKKLPKFLERKQDEAPVQVSFVAQAPITVLFADNKIKVEIRLDDIKVLNNADKAYTITINYAVKVEKKKDKDGIERDIVVLEQTEEPQAFPSNYKSDSGAKLSAVQTMIRSSLMRRLKELPKRVETEPLELEGEWKEAGVLVPVFISSNDGWLTFSCDWQPAKK